MRHAVGVLIMVVLFLAYTYALIMRGEHVWHDAPIESKTPIEPDLVIVVSGGELDTTYVYKRN